MRFTDEQRRRLAVKAKILGRKSCLRSRRSSHQKHYWLGTAKLIAKKYDGSKCRGPAEWTRLEIEALDVRMAKENRS